MESALFTNQDGSLQVDAADLLNIVLDQNNSWTAEEIRREFFFTCLACKVEMIPCAIGTNYKKSPYFKKPKKIPHDLGCDISGYEKLLKRKVRKRVSTPEGFPVPYPSKLVFIEEIVPSGEATSSKPKEYKAEHNYTATLIRTLVKHFIAFPDPVDRNLPLTVPVIGESTYGEIFQRVQYLDGYNFQDLKIYYGQLKYEDIKTTDTEIHLPIKTNLRRDSQSIDVSLEINISTLSQAHIKVIENDIQVCEKEYKKQKSKGKVNFEPWLFFFGKRENNNSFRFQLIKDDFRMLCCITTDLLTEEFFSDVSVPMLSSDITEEPSDDLDERLKEVRRRRAMTFRKVTNLFNKIFGE